MSFIEIITLALIQGITEFLPVSSSAHLILPAQLFGWNDQGIAFDIAAHFGTLCAVLFYFHKDIKQLILDGLAPVLGQGTKTQTKLAWSLVLASIPVAVTGLLLHDWVASVGRSAWVLASTTLLFALLLGWSDRTPCTRNNLEALTWRDALLIGCAQALAVIPGTSRSGITLTMGRFLGFSRTDAARYSFLLAIPTVLMATGYEAWSLSKAPPTSFDAWALFLGASISFGAALACIHVFLSWVTRIGMMPFVIYRIGLGLLLFTLIGFDII